MLATSMKQKRSFPLKLRIFFLIKKNTKIRFCDLSGKPDWPVRGWLRRDNKFVAARVGLPMNLKAKLKTFYGWPSTEAAFALLTQQTQVWLSKISKFYAGFSSVALQGSLMLLRKSEQHLSEPKKLPLHKSEDHAMLEMPDPIQTLKLGNIGPG